jgi:hypothetical protein
MSIPVSAGSAMPLVIAVALLWPRLLTATAVLLGRLGMKRNAPGLLTGANTHVRSFARLGSATTPLIMAVAAQRQTEAVLDPSAAGVVNEAAWQWDAVSRTR